MTVSLVSQAKNGLYFRNLPEGKQTIVPREVQQQKNKQGLIWTVTELSINNQSSLKDALLGSHFNMESILPLEQPLTELVLPIQILTMQLKTEE